MRLSGHSIVVPSAQDWDEPAGSNRLPLMERLAELNRVLFIDSPTRLFSWPGMRRLATICRSDQRTRRIAHNLHVLTPPPATGLARLDRALLLRSVRGACRDLGLATPILWLDPEWPESAELIGGLSEVLVIAQMARPQAQVTAPARAVLARADLAFVSHPHQFRDLGVSARLLPEGIDFERFNRAVHPDTVIPADIASLPRPLVLCLGPVSAAFDFGLWSELALARPAWGFLSIGAIAASAQGAVRLAQQLPNVMFLGERPDEHLAGYLKACAVVAQVNPEGLDGATSLYELSATGKLVVGCDPSAPDRVGIARTAAEFLVALEAAITHDGPRAVYQRIQSARQRTWDSLCRQIEGVVLDALAQRAEPSAIPLLVERVIRPSA